MTETAKLVDVLQSTYMEELETVINYRTNSIVLDGVRAQEIKASLEEDIQEKLGHAELIGQRLKQLGARPPGSADFTAQQESLQPPESSTNVLAVIQGVLDGEKMRLPRIGGSSISHATPTTR